MVGGAENSAEQVLELLDQLPTIRRVVERSVLLFRSYDFLDCQVQSAAAGTPLRF